MRAIQSRCPRCHRPRGWLCAEEGRPCKKKREPRPVPAKLRDRRLIGERVRRYWLRKYGVAA